VKRAPEILAVVLAGAASAAPVMATVLRVPSEYATIQAGLDASVSGDTVLVAPGTYTDWEVRSVVGLRAACAFLVDGVVLKSEGGAAVTTIDMQGNGVDQPSVVFGYLMTSGTTVFEGFTVTGVPSGRDGMFLVDCEKVTVRGSVFRDMVGSSGALTAKDSDIGVSNCVFQDLGGSIGAGMSVSDADFTVDNCTFANCFERGIWAVGLNTKNHSGSVTNSTFIGNSEGSGGGGGVSIGNYLLGVTISGCYFEGNVTVAGGGAIGVGGGTPGPWMIQDCVFVNNIATGGGSGGGAVSTGGSGILSGCTFVGNQAGAGGAAAFFQAGAITLSHNVFYGSVGPEAVHGFQTPVSPDCNVYWNNAGGDVTGFTMAPTSRVLDPLFCDPAAGDFSVSTDSPCLPANSVGCGRIGALGEGCSPVSAGQRSWGTIKGGYR
jgi:hypothetical protein